MDRDNRSAKTLSSDELLRAARGDVAGPASPVTEDDQAGPPAVAEESGSDASDVRERVPPGFVTCSGCGRSVDATSTACMHCGAHLVGSRRVGESVLETASSVPPSAPVGTPRAAGYKSVLGLARLLKMLLGLWVVLAAVAAAASLVEYRLASRLLDDPLSVSVSQVEASDDRQAAIYILWIAALIVTAIGYVAWMYRLHRNVRPLGSSPPRHSAGWVIGGWLIPFLNLVRPKQIIDDLWRASDPDLPLEAGDGWLRQRRPVLLHVWWGLWIIGGLGGQYLAANRDTADLESLRAVAGIDVAVDLIFAAAAIAAFLVVALLTQRQEDRAARVFADDTARGQGTARRPGLVALLLAVAGLASLGFGSMAFDTFESGRGVSQQSAVTQNTGVESGSEAVTPVDPLTPAGSGTATFVHDLTVGDCWNSDDFVAAAVGETVDLFAVEVVPCAGPHFAEAFATARYPGGSSEPYPGDIEVQLEAQRVCFARFEDDFDVSYESSTMNIIPLFPRSQSWSFGDRDILCSVIDVRGGLLLGAATEIDTVLPGADIDPLGAGSCEDVVDLALLNAQEYVDAFDAWDSVTDEQLAALGPNDLLPGVERAVKVDAMLAVRIDALGCPIVDLNRDLSARRGELTSSSMSGEATINMFVRDGYWIESAFP